MKAGFEASFADFIEGKEYDEAENALFTIVRSAYQACRSAAGGDPPQPRQVLRLIKEHPAPEETKSETRCPSEPR